MGHILSSRFQVDRPADVPALPALDEPAPDPEFELTPLVPATLVVSGCLMLEETALNWDMCWLACTVGAGSTVRLLPLLSSKNKQNCSP